MNDNSYHNTTGETGDTLAGYERKAMSQEDTVLRLVTDSQDGMTPSDVHKCMEDGTLLTSVRRCLSNLTRRGLLRKTDELQMGVHGRLEHVWCASDN